MTRIPIDLAAPIACTATSSEISKRVQQLDRLRDQLTSIERTPEGLLLRFKGDRELEAHLEQFVLDEKGCCQFWGFDLATTATDLILRWDGPPDVQPLMDELEGYLRSDEPLTAIAGLL